VFESLQSRDALSQRIRAFFHAEGFDEVETPLVLKTPCMELHIDAIPSGDGFLRTSPELCHKKLLAQGAEKIFEIGKCFRQGEQGALHNPEYTMLEWYRTGSDYITALEDTKRLLIAVVAGVDRGKTRPADASTEEMDFCNPWKIFTVVEAFEEFAGWNPVESFDADRFDLDLVEKVEPSLPKDCPVVLKDYPAELCALARLKPGNPKIAERWELYLGGVEIANAYSELTDPVEQRARFEHCGEQRRALGKTVYPIDEEFIDCLKTMPEASGVALGVDRLLMILLGAKNLDAVLPFRT
jgi:lysyl-tRNA synthetase class 2